MSDWVIMGRVSGLFGLQGWVKVFSHTQPRHGIVSYRSVFLEQGGAWQPFTIAEGRAQGAGVVVKFLGYENRDQAATLIECKIAVRRDQLPALSAGEYYWTDLQGLRVLTVDGVELGTVDHLFATGANDVLVVKGERQRLIPFVKNQVVREIDLEQGLVRVDWDADF